MSKRQLRILFAYRSDIDADGGAGRVMLETCKALANLGLQVEVTYDMRPNLEGFDLVHVFNLWEPGTALNQLKYLRRSGVPVIWSPFYLDWCEFAWAALAFELLYRKEHPPEERKRIFDAFSSGKLDINGLSQFRPNEYYPGFHRTLREMLLCVDHVCTASLREIQKLAQITGNPSIPFSVTPHGTDAASLRSATPDLFVSRFGIRDFVLCVGVVGQRKNQLMLLEALRGTSHPVVLIGPYRESDYLAACRGAGGDRLLLTGRLPADLVASAYKAASVHVLPSYAEAAALANLEAAISGCAMVVSNRCSEFEYFGDAPYYCSPNDPASIREAVHLAMESRRDKDRWEELSRNVEAKFTWRKTAELTMKAYERVLSGRSAPL